MCVRTEGTTRPQESGDYFLVSKEGDINPAAVPRTGWLSESLTSLILYREMGLCVHCGDCAVVCQRPFMDVRLLGINDDNNVLVNVVSWYCVFLYVVVNELCFPCGGFFSHEQYLNGV